MHEDKSFAKTCDKPGAQLLRLLSWVRMESGVLRKYTYAVNSFVLKSVYIQTIYSRDAIMT